MQIAAEIIKEDIYSGSCDLLAQGHKLTKDRMPAELVLIATDWKQQKPTRVSMAPAMS